MVYLFTLYVDFDEQFLQLMKQSTLKIYFLLGLGFLHLILRNHFLNFSIQIFLSLTFHV